MAVKLRSPHPFAEKFLLFGGGGAGKTNVVLNIATHLAEGVMHVIDTDFSAPYERALATEYTGIAERMNVTVADTEWTPFTETLAKTVETGDPEHDWLVIDMVSISWDAVQDWYLEQVYGHDLPAHIVELRKAYSDAKEYNAALTDNMNWSTIKKEYARRLWMPLRKWHGNLILCAEAKQVGNRDDKQVKMLYGPLGFKPSGESRMSHVAATNLFLDHPRRGVWRMTTVKDRNRDELDKEPIDDFGMDYLVEVAGWEPVRKRKGGT